MSNDPLTKPEAFRRWPFKGAWSRRLTGKGGLSQDEHLGCNEEEELRDYFCNPVKWSAKGDGGKWSTKGDGFSLLFSAPDSMPIVQGDVPP